MREVWILAQHAPVLLKVEKLLRKPNANPLIHALKGVSTAMTNGPVTTQTLLPDFVPYRTLTGYTIYRRK